MRSVFPVQVKSMQHTTIAGPAPFQAEQPIPERVILGQSPAMSGIRARLAKVASADVPVLIRGESGTGKELLGKLIHAWSPRRDRPFVKIACPSLAPNLLESELFGYERGAFTGAYSAKAGLVETAHQGTLFLDEVAELDVSLQAKLLQLLQDGRYCRIGGNEERHIETRVLCSTNHSIERDLQLGYFRPDLYYRINVLGIEMPPLRDRRSDIPELVQYFLARHNRLHGSHTPPPSTRLLEVFLQYDWPGNIRELDNLMKRYVILDSEESVIREVLGSEGGDSQEITPGDNPRSLKELTRAAVRELERRIILQALRANNWNRKETARSLDISYRGLFYKIKQVGVPPKKAVTWSLMARTTDQPRAAQERLKQDPRLEDGDGRRDR